MESAVLAVVPVYNGQNFVSRAIKSLLSQNYPSLKIVVIDDYSKDQSYPLILKEFSDFPQIIVVRNEKNVGLAQTLNKALGFATSEEFLLVLEQDCELLDNNYITNSLKHFNCNHVGVVSGENLPAEDKESSSTKKIFVHHLCEDVHDNSVVEVGFSLLKADVFRVDVLRKVGGFESSAKWKFACEEHMISYKIRSLGYKIIKDSSLRFRAYWGRQETLWQNLKKEAVYGRGLGWAFGRMRSDLEVGESKQLRSKKFNRMIQAQYVSLTALSVFLFLYNLWLSLAMLSLATLIQFVYLCGRALYFNGVRARLLFIVTGFLRSWVYIPSFCFGFLYGFIINCKEKILSPTKVR